VIPGEISRRCRDPRGQRHVETVSVLHCRICGYLLQAKMPGSAWPEARGNTLNLRIFHKAR